MSETTTMTPAGREDKLAILLEKILEQNEQILEQQEELFEQIRNLDRGTPGYGLERSYDDLS